MRKTLLIAAAVLLSSRAAFAATLLAPEEVFQGSPVRVTTEGAAFLKDVMFDGARVPIFTYNGRTRAFIGIDLKKTPGKYTLTAKLTNGATVSKTITVIARGTPTVASVDIPEALGGNTTSSQNNLLASISAADADIKKIKTGAAVTWTQKFIPPLAALATTNPYGYSVSTGAYTLPHKGVDLEAAVGTPVVAMNRGVVKIAREYRSYGKMVVLDHGLRVQTLYLHLSKMNVKVGDTIARGKIIGLSGESGYVSGPHLHLSVRIGGTSIDPVPFLKLFTPSLSVKEIL
ncbi:MAG: M23 family metallopeptidase [Candidatus Liptonbacteria bacterium]|nr:M23 family metallopeptidase [Candidatus Liptonbacteria bacterium]